MCQTIISDVIHGQDCDGHPITAIQMCTTIPKILPQLDDSTDGCLWSLVKDFAHGQVSVTVRIAEGAVVFVDLDAVLNKPAVIPDAAVAGLIAQLEGLPVEEVMSVRNAKSARRVLATFLRQLSDRLLYAQKYDADGLRECDTEMKAALKPVSKTRLKQLDRELELA